MRETRNAQASIFEFYSEHEHGLQLKALSELLDAHPDILDIVARDLIPVCASNTGAQGLSVERSRYAARLSTVSMPYASLIVQTP